MNICEDLTAYIAAFRSAYEHRARSMNPNVIEFCAPPRCKGFISKISLSKNCRFLIQTQYYQIWKLCEERLLSNKNPATSSQTVILGTDGIGKSAARLLYICMWLLNETSVMVKFDKTIFNFSNEFFAVDKRGTVRSVDIYRETKSRALMLLDPCNYLSNAQDVPCAMLIVFSSPSFLVSQSEKPNLSGLSKTSTYYVMDPPTVRDMQSLGFTYDAKRLENFSWDKNGTRFCALRWFSYEEDEIPSKLSDCLSNVSRDGLWDWFVTSSTPTSKDHRLPFRLCVVESDHLSSWTVTRFISPAIEQFLSQWSTGTGQRQAHQIANILQNRVLKGGLGIFFERWLFDKLGDGLPLQMPDLRPLRTEISFSELKIIPESSLGMEEGAIYKLERATFPSIEGYAIFDQNIYLLQSTVSSTHGGARYSDVQHIVTAAVAERRIRRLSSIIVVYIAPSKQAFNLPECVGFPGTTRVVRGSVADEEFFGMVHTGPATRKGPAAVGGPAAGAPFVSPGGTFAGPRDGRGRYRTRSRGRETGAGGADTEEAAFGAGAGAVRQREFRGAETEDEDGPARTARRVGEEGARAAGKR